MLNSAGVSHPYLSVLRANQFADTHSALQDFAFQYGLYSARFTEYVDAVVGRLACADHRAILESNLAEEHGHSLDIELPSDVLASVEGVSHAELFRRFQSALGVTATDIPFAPDVHPGHIWCEQFLALCRMNECVGIGALGFGTEMIVAPIYEQILQGLAVYSPLSPQDRVFFELHSQCDEAHGEEMYKIAWDLAKNPLAIQHIEYGARTAIALRVKFWDAMLERGQAMPVQVANH